MKNWRTTAVGVLGGIFWACLPIMKSGTFDIHTDWINLVEAAGIVVFGYFAKDAGVSGEGK
jgi:hypothetical protein